MHQSYAFFDFDETVFRYKSMFAFAQYYLESIDELYGAERFGQLMDQIEDMSSGGADRSEINRFYYSQYAGHKEQVVQNLSYEWYESLCASGDSFLIDSVVAHAQELKNDGTTLALVSGAFAPILRPFAEKFGFSELICSTPEVVDGIYTGKLIGRAVIGDEKGHRVTKMLQSRSVPAEICFAFGDHRSDLAMLEAVGNATVVNPDPSLEQIAIERGWAIIQG